ncbi:probable cytochrome P450 9f2 [Toxorhynchites rutilus septentrionalis]|uniref:probable cytochrome P450 9f2 n=1 Tax=Toxorhynchites rutilus septentrionalis TaxID=329112 RepID=UPI002478ECA1|nr:probable cytochrome P450 9f2 [Toxorhynchites rutilus septentrionalis]
MLINIVETASWDTVESCYQPNSDMVMLTLLLVLLPFFAVIYLLYRWSIPNYEYFEQRKVPFIKPTIGSAWSFFSGKQHFLDAASEGYWRFPESKFSGYFTFHKPGYLIHDPELLKRILIKDFDHFTDHENIITPEIDPFFGRSLFFTEGLRWRHGRTALSPAFTGSKMRNMFDLFTIYTAGAMKRLVEDAKGDKLEKEMKDLFQRLGNDVMTSISFGVEIDSVRDPENIFFLNGKRLTTFSRFAWLKFILLAALPPKASSILGLRITPRDVAEFYEKLVSQTIQEREKKKIVRPDFINILLQARKNELKDDQPDDRFDSAGFSTVKEHLTETEGNFIQWTDLDITATAASFFFGGIETTTVVLCFAVYELSLNPEIQDRLRAEIDDIEESLADGKLTYEAMQRMKYLDMVVSEALRRWPPLGLTNRKCTKDYVMENTDGSKVTVEKGQVIQFSIWAIHRDGKFYPDPLRFDPERFSEENRNNINQDAYLPFGGGPRNCVGSRLALMQAKCFLYYLLANFVVEISKRTDVPIQIDTRSIGIDATNGFWFNLIPREK